MKLSDIALVLVINLVWGLTFIAAKLALAELPAIWFTGIRFALLCLVLAPMLRWVPGQMPRLLVVALFCGAVHFALQYGGLYLAEDVSTVAVVTQTQLPFSVLLAVLFLGERLTALRFAGIAAAFGGVVVIGFDPRVMGYGTAVVLILLASIAMATAQVLMRGLRNVAIFNLQAWIALLSAPSLLGLSLLIESNQIEMSRAASWAAWGNLAFTAFGSSLIGFAGMFHLLRRYPVTLVTPMFLLAPIFGIVAGVTVLGDVLTPRMMLGGALTLAGVLAVTLAPAPKAAA